MINSLDGPVLLNDAFGALLGFNIAAMLNYIENPKVCGDEVEYGVPFFDDLRADQKAIALYKIVVGMFSPTSPILKENAHHAAAFMALENHVKKGIGTEIKTRHWSKKKYGKENRIQRALTIAAFKSRYPRSVCPDAEAVETSAFVKMIDRLFTDIRPKPYFLIADVPKAKRSTLMKRLALPDDYFEPLEGKTKMSEKDRIEQRQVLLGNTRIECIAVLNHWIQSDRSVSAKMVAKELSTEKAKK